MILYRIYNVADPERPKYVDRGTEKRMRNRAELYTRSNKTPSVVVEEPVFDQKLRLVYRYDPNPAGGLAVESRPLGTLTVK